MKLDKTDKKILNILQKDGRITNAKLAKKIGMSPPPTLERVKKLEKSGVIRKYVALIDPVSIGKNTFTFVSVSLIEHEKKKISDFYKTVQKIDEIMECHLVTGDADYLLKIAVKDIKAYEQLLIQKLLVIPNVHHFKTIVVLSTHKNKTELKINEEADG